MFISAQRDYYPLDRVPEYWEWLAHHADAGEIKVPRPIWDELQPHDESLRDWLRDHQDALVLDPDESDILVSDVLIRYGEDLNEEELERIGADPFLVAAAMHHGAIVVSKEGSKPTKTRVNRRVPDICDELGVTCITDHRLIVDLNFSTGWQP